MKALQKLESDAETGIWFSKKQWKRKGFVDTQNQLYIIRIWKI